MKFTPLKIQGAFKIELSPHLDHRGFFVRTYDRGMFREQGLVTDWIQESHSFSLKKGTVRGMHFQRPPFGETKLVRMVQGNIFMGLLDLREGSSTFRQSDNVVLSVEKPELLYVPKGLAMGMCTLTDNVSLLYKIDMEFHPECARTILWNDPDINIPWPITQPAIISDKDRSAPLLKDFLELEGAL